MALGQFNVIAQDPHNLVSWEEAVVFSHLILPDQVLPPGDAA